MEKTFIADKPQKRKSSSVKSDENLEDLPGFMFKKNKTFANFYRP